MKCKIVGLGKKQRYFIDGEEVTKAKWNNAFPPREETGCEGLIGWKPMVNEVLAVHPDQVKEAIESARAKGVPTDFKADGQPVFTSRAHYKEYCEKYGFYNKDGGYGDARRHAPR